MVGPSGSGKSIALERLLLPALRDQNIRCHYAATRSHWPDPTAARDKVIVLDQFEHALISLPWGTRRAADALEEIRQDVRGLAGNARAVVLGVRYDWYIRLTFINDLLPPLSNTVVLSELGVALDNQLVQQFNQRVRELLPNAPDAPVPTDATPVMLQASGQLLELSLTDPGLGDRSTVPPVESALDDLVELYVSRSPVERVTWKALHALQAARLAAGSLTIRELSGAIAEVAPYPEEVTRYLHGTGLVLRRGAKYELTHDALIPTVERLTASRLNPDERDTIRVGVAEKSQLPATSKRLVRFAYSCYALLLVVVVSRLTTNSWEGWHRFSTVRVETANALFDPLYLAVAIPHLLWCYYIMMHQVRLYAYGDREHQRSLSYIGTALQIGRAHV